MGPRSFGPAAIMLALAAAVLFAAPATSAQQPREPRARILVGFDPGVSVAAQRASLERADATATDAFAGFTPSSSPCRPPTGVRHWRSFAGTRACALRSRTPSTAIDTLPNDPLFGQLWGLNNTGQTVKSSTGSADADIDAPEAWSTTTGSSSVVVAVIDSGVDWHHPDLAANIWTNPGESCAGCASDGIDNDGNGYVDDVHGWDFVNNDNDPFDDNGHGTHVAGTIGASGSNGVGIAGVNWNVQIMPLKFIGANGQGTADDAVRAILYATRMGAVASNNSWGGEEFSQALEDAIADADAHGSLFVAAAGNSGKNTDTTPDYPSGFDLPNVITVGATDQNDVRAWFSNYGKQSVDLAAPGHEHLLDLAGRYLPVLRRHLHGSAARDRSRRAREGGLPVRERGRPQSPDPPNRRPERLIRRARAPPGGRLNARAAVTCGSGAQVWIESPAPGFEVDVGKPVSVTVLGAACGDPAGAAVGSDRQRLGGRARAARRRPLHRKLHADCRGRGPARRDHDRRGGIGHAHGFGHRDLHAGHRSRRGSGHGHHDVARRGRAARLRRRRRPANQPQALRRHDRNLLLLSAKISILKPDGSTLLSASSFGTSGGFIDTKTLPQTGAYRILVDPQSNAVGSVTLTLYDVPEDAESPVVPGGAPASAETTAPGQNAAFLFDALAGDRVSLKLSDVTIGTSCCSSAKISILKPDGSTLLSASSFGTSGGFIDTKTLPQTGAYRILVDPQSNAVGSVTLTLYDVPEDAESPVVPGGAPASAETTAPGQNAAFLFDALAGDRVSLKLSDVTIGTSCCSSAKISILKPDGSTLLSASSFGTSGGFIDTKTLPQTGAYRILVDPQSNAVGSVTLTLYDVPDDPTGTLVLGGAASTLALDVPGQNGWRTFSGTAGRTITLRLTAVTIGTSCCSSAKVSVLRPDGTTLVSPANFGTSGKTLSFSLPATGVYSIFVDPQSNGVGSATLSVS